MGVNLELASSRAGEWYVIAEGTYLVGFRGLHARELAVRQQRELTALFNAAAAEVEERNSDEDSTVQDD
jgi:hypothetical protein